MLIHRELSSCGRGCQSHWDVRCRCELACPTKNSIAQFNACPVMVDSLSEFLQNDYAIYKTLFETTASTTTDMPTLMDVLPALREQFGLRELTTSELEQLLEWLNE